mgnify:CR=1 FL=1|jgi:hypothetical protein
MIENEQINEIKGKYKNINQQFHINDKRMPM